MQVPTCKPRHSCHCANDKCTIGHLPYCTCCTSLVASVSIDNAIRQLAQGRYKYFLVVTCILKMIGTKPAACILVVRIVPLHAAGWTNKQQQELSSNAESIVDAVRAAPASSKPAPAGETWPATFRRVTRLQICHFFVLRIYSATASRPVLEQQTI